MTLGGSNSGGNPVDTGLSTDPGRDWIPPTTHCINTWFKVDGKWKIINYCGNP